MRFYRYLDSETVENPSYDAGLQNNRYIDDDEDDEAEDDFDDQVDEDDDENDIDELSDEFPTESRFTAHHLIQVSFLSYYLININHGVNLAPSNYKKKVLQK